MGESDRDSPPPDALARLRLRSANLPGSAVVRSPMVSKPGGYKRPINGKKLDFYQELFVHRYYKLIESARAPDAQVSVDEEETADESGTAESTSDAEIEAFAARLSASLRPKLEVKEEDTKESEAEEPDFDAFLRNFTGGDLEQRVLRGAWGVLKDASLAELGTAEGPSGDVDRRALLQRNATRLRAAFAKGAVNMRRVRLCHWTLARELTVPFLCRYLRLLQALRLSAAELVDELCTKEPVEGGLSMDLYYLLKKEPSKPVPPLPLRRNPSLEVLFQRRLERRAHFLFLEPRFRAPGEELLGRPKDLAHDGLYRSLLPALCSSLSRLSFEVRNREAGLGQTTEGFVDAVKARVWELRKQYRDSELVVVAWGWAGPVALRALKEAPAAALVCLAFPNLTRDGRRGDVDDAMLSANVPTLFVVGQFSAAAAVDDLQDSRELMQAGTGLTLVGGADENLRLTSRKLRTLRIDQATADAAIAASIREFLEAWWGWDFFRSSPAAPQLAHPVRRRRSYAHERTEPREVEVTFGGEKKPRLGPPPTQPKRPALPSSFAAEPGTSVTLRPASVEAPPPPTKRQRPPKAKRPPTALVPGGMKISPTSLVPGRMSAEGYADYTPALVRREGGALLSAAYARRPSPASAPHSRRPSPVGFAPNRKRSDGLGWSGLEPVSLIPQHAGPQQVQGSNVHSSRLHLLAQVAQSSREAEDDDEEIDPGNND